MRAASVLIAVSVLVGCGRPSDAKFASLRSQAEPAIQAIEAYKTSHGTYPSNLTQAGIRLPEAGYGGWKYSSHDDGYRFQLSVGDYEENGFVLFWSSDYQDWYLDT